MNTILNREVAYAALFARLSGLREFKTITRRLKHWQDVSAEEQPALYMEHTGENAYIVRGQPTRIVLEVDLWIYVQTEWEPAGPALNPLLDSIQTVLEPSNVGDRVMTLNSVVHHVWIEGQTQIFEGDLGTTAVAIVPVKMLVT